MMDESRLLGSSEVDTLIKDVAEKLRAHLAQRNIENPLIIGIHTGGAWVAKCLHDYLQVEEPLGVLDISFYRDDFTRIGMHPEVRPSNIPHSVENRHIILVDDVLQSGRTVRAAMNEIFDFGRPASVSLAILVDRSGRELPVEANVYGMKVENPHDHVTLTGPEPLNLIIGQPKAEVRAGTAG